MYYETKEPNILRLVTINGNFLIRLSFEDGDWVVYDQEGIKLYATKYREPMHKYLMTLVLLKNLGI